MSKQRVAKFVRKYRFPLIGLAVAAIVVGVVVSSSSGFAPQYYFDEVVGYTDTEETFDIAKGQVLKMRFVITPSHEELVVVVRQGTRLSSGAIQTGYIMKDEPRIQSGDIVTFKAPHSGTYVVSMRTRSGDRASARVEYSLSE